MNGILPKQPRSQLDAESYERLRVQVLGVMAGDVNIAAPDLTWRFITKSFAVGAEMILKRT